MASPAILHKSNNLSHDSPILITYDLPHHHTTMLATRFQQMGWPWEFIKNIDVYGQSYETRTSRDVALKSVCLEAP